MKLTLIIGNREKLEHRLIDKIQNGEEYQEELNRMRPKGDLRLAYSSENKTANDSDYDWLIVDESSY